LRVGRWLVAALFALLAFNAFGFGTSARFVIVTNQDAASSSLSGTWNTQSPPACSGCNPTFYGEYYVSTPGSGGAETAAWQWNFGTLASIPGPYSFDAFVPDTGNNSGTAVIYRLESSPYNLFSGTCGSTYSLVTTFSPVSLDNYEGRWAPIGTATLNPSTCYRLVLSNSGNSGAIIPANAVRAERLYESSYTVVDIPRVSSVLAAGTTSITSNSNAAPTIIATLTVTCPAAGQVLVTGSGESAAVTSIAGNNFNGLAYSISKNSTATDNNNVVQSSSLAVFNGDANRDFLSVQRVDSCASGESITYRLTGYRAQVATGTSSFMWNGRMVAQFYPAVGF
jgi:hypothetical protein